MYIHGQQNVARRRGRITQPKLTVKKGFKPPKAAQMSLYKPKAKRHGQSPYQLD